MTHTSRAIVFFGTEDFSVVTLDALIAAGYNVALVVTKPDSPRGRGRRLTAPLVKTRAQTAKIPVLQPAKLVDIIPYLQKLTAPVGVLVSYGKIIPQSVINCFTPGIINVHPSLLPKYRGPSPIESAILNGDTTTGVSIMQLTKAMDAGPIYKQESFSLLGTETSKQLYADLAEKGARLLIKTLPSVLEGTSLPEAQDESQATYCPLLKKQDGILEPSHMTAEACERLVRAFMLYPKVKLSFYTHLCIILEAHTSTTPSTTQPSQKCKDGNFFIVDKLIGPNGKTMSGEDFMRGYIRN